MARRVPNKFIRRVAGDPSSLENVARSERKQIAAISVGISSLRAVAAGSVSLSGTSYQYRTSKTALNMPCWFLQKNWSLAPSA